MGTKKASELISVILSDFGSKAARADLTQSLEEILGSDEVEHCRITGFKAGHLWVEVDSAPLFAELSGFRQETIRSEMNRRLDKRKVSRITFRMGGMGHA